MDKQTERIQKISLKVRNGTGLGLFIVKGIIEGHGGGIWAENNIDGKVQLFALTLPIEKPLRKAQIIIEALLLSMIGYY